MAEGLIQVPPDSTGKRTRTRTQTIGAVEVHSSVVAVQDATGVLITPITDTQIRATALPVVLPAETTKVIGTVNLSLGSPLLIFKGRACTFRTPGRAGTAGQNILSLHNATGSPVRVDITRVFVDLASTVVKAVTVSPPIVRLWKVTVLPTNGSALVKTKLGGSGASSSSLTILGDASADGTGSGTTLTSTRPAGTFITQEYAPRILTAVGYESSDRLEWLGEGNEVTIAPLEGVVLFIDYILATQNPITDMWIAGIEWREYTI